MIDVIWGREGLGKVYINGCIYKYRYNFKYKYIYILYI